MKRHFTSYAHETFAADQLLWFAAQYDGVDMATLKGATETNFPFLVRHDSHPLRFVACWWNAYSGIMTEMNDDEVEDYAFVTYLLEHAYPRFDTYEDAEKWSIDHNWPRRHLDDLPKTGG